MYERKYKLVSKRDGKYYSWRVGIASERSKARIEYKLGYWVTSPKWLAEFGFYPLVFDCLDNLFEFLRRDISPDERIFVVEVKEKQPLPTFCITSMLSKGAMVSHPTGSFPRGTECWKWVRPVSLVFHSDYEQLSFLWR